MSFRQRLALFLIVTLAVVQSLTAFSAYLYLRRDLLTRAKVELGAATGVFTRQLDFLSDRVADAVQVLSLDFALRTAIGRRDYATVLSALRNHGRRIGATRMVIADLDGRITADTVEGDGGRRFPYPDLLKTAERADKTTGLISAEGRLFWTVVVPVRAPIPIAYIAAFIPIDDALVQKVRAISSSQEAIALVTRGPGGHWMIAAESAVRRRTIQLPLHKDITPSSSVVTDQGQEYLAYTAPLDATTGSAPVAVMLEYPLHDALAAYRGIILPMIGVLLLGLLAMLAGTAFIVRGVSRPLESLAAAARRIAAGDYTPPPHLKRRDEIGSLADALETMTASVAERERDLRDAVVVTERAKNEAVRANLAKSEFLSNMSHELRTPLNAILGFSEMIKVQALGPLGVSKYADYASDIYGAGQHLLTLVERILCLAEADANRLVLKHELVSAGEQMDAALADLRPLAAEVGVRLVSDASEAWPQVSGEAAKLQQAFYNVLHNAIRFTSKGGTVSVSGTDVGGALTIAISDTGCGMDSELVETVTRPFHRLRSAFDGTHQGAGLGLPFAKAVVELHGGSLKIASVLNEGTVVTITLPDVQAQWKAA